MKNMLIISEAKPALKGHAEETAFGYLSKFILERKYKLTYVYIKIKNTIKIFKIYNQTLDSITI